MSGVRIAIPVALALCTATVWGQGSPREPHMGYLYPAGGKQGATFQVLIGGQLLRGAADAYVSGSGVQASVIRHFPPLGNLSAEQRDALARRMRGLIEERWSELAKDGQVGATPPWDRLSGAGLNLRRRDPGGDDPNAETVELPEHPLFYRLEEKSLRELLQVVHDLRNLRKGQRNAQIAESVLIEVTIDRQAAPGDRELRLGTPQGLTNPMVFQVGILAELREQEIGDDLLSELLSKEPPLELPFLMNGQIMPGDVDLLRFRAHRGQHLVIETHARHLIPYLADAVPGWFQATLALYNSAGDHLAFVDDYQFNPDPVLLYEVPEDGEYVLEIRDSIYRGREDFVYRISIGERPFITSIFPLGCRTGLERFVAIDGWNLSTTRLFLDAPAKGALGVRQKRHGRGNAISNLVTYIVDALPAAGETEPNDDAAAAQRVRLSRIADGRIGRPGDVDVFKFKGKAGAEIVAEVSARRLRSPLDSLLRLMDSEGTILAWNDDYENKEGFLYTDPGVLTHHADSYLRARLPKRGEYYIQVSDAQSHGGDEYAYRLRIGPPQPDFELCVTPSSINVRGGFAAPLRVFVLRKDGFDGKIELVLKNAPPGFLLAGARIAAGRDSVRATLSAPPQVKEPVVLALEGRAKIGGKVVKRPVVPAEDMMQAFLYRHLTPSQELMVAVTGGRRFGRPLQLADEAPVRIPAGGVAQVRIITPPHPKIRELELELNQPPPGITLQRVTPEKGGLVIELAADRDTAKVGLADNLIVEAFLEVERGGKEGQPPQQKQRISLGFLPAIPFEIVPQLLRG